MSTSDTIIIFQKPELYFFPCYKDIVYAPFSVSEGSSAYYVYRFLHLFRLPGYSLFWRNWGRKLKAAKQVIIFDYGYQRGMEKFIRHANPDCKVFIFYWNRVGKYNSLPLHTIRHENIYSTDPADCDQYHLKYNHIFYPKRFYTPASPTLKNRLFFLGADKGRSPYIASLKEVLIQSGLDCDIRVVCRNSDSSYRRQYHDILTSSWLSYEEYLKLLERCNILLEVCQKGQTALTMRTLESIYLSKKLITNNCNIVDYDFYNPANIFVLPESGSLPTPEDIRDFLSKPFVPYTDDILNAYSFEHWKAQF